MQLVLGALAVVLLATAPPPAAQEIRREQVQFKPGGIGATVKGRIKGEQTVDYVLQAKARQTLVVILESSNRSCYFNVTGPGEDAALFIGSTSGSRFVGEAPKDGEYTVRLYLMRSAARRGESGTTRSILRSPPRCAELRQPGGEPAPGRHLSRDRMFAARIFRCSARVHPSS